MSNDDVSTRRGGLGVYAESVGEGTIERAAKLLAGIDGGVQKAINSAMKRAVKTGETYASKVIRKEYTIGAADFTKYTRSKSAVAVEGNTTAAVIQYKGFHIPLLRFDHSIGKDGLMSVRVEKSSARTVLKRAFAAEMKSGHIGLFFERETDDRLPIRQFFGPSTPQMMDANEEVSKEIGEKVQETFDKRLDHEVTRILNGWGTK